MVEHFILVKNVMKWYQSPGWKAQPCRRTLERNPCWKDRTRWRPTYIKMGGIRQKKGAHGLNSGNCTGNCDFMNVLLWLIQKRRARLAVIHNFPARAIWCKSKSEPSCLRADELVNFVDLVAQHFLSSSPTLGTLG